jgi:hypothetical protein
MRRQQHRSHRFKIRSLANPSFRHGRQPFRSVRLSRQDRFQLEALRCRSRRHLIDSCDASVKRSAGRSVSPELTSADQGNSFPLVRSRLIHGIPRAFYVEPLQSRINSLTCPVKRYSYLGGLFAGIQESIKLGFLVRSPSARR